MLGNGWTYSKLGNTKQSMDHYSRVGNRSGSAGTEILSENLEEDFGQMENNARKRLGLPDIGAY